MWKTTKILIYLANLEKDFRRKSRFSERINELEKESEQKKGNESTATLNSISKFKESLSSFQLCAPFPVSRATFGGSFLLLKREGPTTKPMRPKNGSLDQNRQWRREAAPIKSILAKNSLRSQIAEKEGFHTLPNSFFLSGNGASLHLYNLQQNHWFFSLPNILNSWTKYEFIERCVFSTKMLSKISLLYMNLWNVGWQWLMTLKHPLKNLWIEVKKLWVKRILLSCLGK